VTARGVDDRKTVGEALAWIDASVRELAPETVDLAGAVGRVLANDVAAAIDVPPFDRAAIDGIALRADETIGAGPYNPLSFRLASSAEALPTAAAVRVSAGDPLPRAADAVASLDRVQIDDAAGTCEVVDALAPGSGIERTGDHAARGAALLTRARRLHPGDIGALAAAGIARVPVVRRPAACVVQIGTGFAERGAPLRPGLVYETNGLLLEALIERDGGSVVGALRVDRDRMALRDALSRVGGDIVFVVGGTGRGPRDTAAEALAAAGELALHGVALRPCETAGMGQTAAGTPVFLLPGAPPACFWAYEFFGGRALRRMAGRDPAPPYPRRELASARKIVSEIGVAEVCPVRRLADGRVEPIPGFAESGIAAMARADGFVVVPEGSEGFAQGAMLTAYLFGGNSRE
jgi:molybdopterin molybdotransferase